MTVQMIEIEKGGSLIVVVSAKTAAVKNTATGNALVSAFAALGYPKDAFSAIIINAQANEANKREFSEELMLAIEECDPLAVLALDEAAAEHLQTSYKQLVEPKHLKLFENVVFLNGRRTVFLKDFAQNLNDDTKKRADWTALKHLNFESLIKINT